MIEINGINLRSKNVFVERGAKERFLRLPDAKDYLTESVREEDGDLVVFHNPKVQSREIEVNFFVKADTEDGLWERRGWLLRLLHSSEVRLCFKDVNRVFSLVYVGGDSPEFGWHSGKPCLRVPVTFRENNPSDVRKEVFLASDGVFITTSGKLIKCLIKHEF